MNEVKILTEENEKMFSKTQVDEFVEKAKQEILDKLKSMIENGEGMLTILQKFYPNYVIASSKGNYYFFPISEKLEKNNFELEKFTYPDMTKKMKNGVELLLICRERRKKQKKELMFLLSREI